MKAMSFYENTVIFLFCLFFSACTAVYFGKDLSWDLANYHYYNPYAFLQNRSNIDYWPTSFIHLFFTPTADFFTYYLINHFSPLATVIIMGTLQGLNIWFTYLIATCFVKNKYFALLLAIIGTYSAQIFTSLGGFENDNVMNIFVLSYLYLQIKILQHYHDNKKLSALWLMLSGFLLGIGLGIKLTASLYVVGALSAIFLLPIAWQARFKMMGYLLLSLCVGFIATSGYWLVILWQKYQNPFFPFFNGIFHSTYYSHMNFNFNVFLPKTWLEIVFFPLYFSLDGSLGDQVFMDLRYAITFTLFILFGIHYLYAKIKHTVTPLPLTQFWLFTFTIFSYLTWEYYFAIVRYIGVLALLAPLLIYLLVTHLIPYKKISFAILTLLYAAIVITMTSSIIVRNPVYDTTYFNVEIPKNIQANKNSLVLIAYSAYALSNEPKPQSYLIPFFPKGWRFIGIPFNDVNPFAIATNERTQIQTLIEQHENSIFLLATEKTMPSFYRIAKGFGLVADGNCELISSDRQKISSSKSYICPVRKEI